ncbi:tRNA (adenine(22)-N(1))-methyltransferase TrmK [Pseudogracilibacillus sp. SE30717A]|uniref:tRNA (adenine(22)-N(1))-methyltransferase n=1 Tax=Pseudogracilibacillus sp. SE30717A TaxID=3098293 RepID=UPI00300E02C7
MKIESKLSHRLKMIASFLTAKTCFADIGSDHGYLPCYVCLHDPFAQAIAGEVREGPYRRAIETVQQYDLAKRIEVRLGNGLDVIQDNDHINEIVVAGMGGSLISKILANGSKKLNHVNRLILQPNNHAHLVRQWLFHNGYSLVNEVIMEENDHIYEIIIGEKKSETLYQETMLIEKQFMFGPILINEKTPVFLKKWEHERIKLLHVIRQMKHAKNMDEEKLTLYETQLRWIEEVLS